VHKSDRPPTCTGAARQTEAAIAAARDVATLWLAFEQALVRL